MIIYAQYLGWLHAAPKLKATDTENQTRYKKFNDEGQEIEYPPCQLNYMVDYLFSAGLSISGINGDSPLTHQEILAWRKNMQIDICPWEANTLREMSRHYLAQMIKSDKYDAPPPWIPEINEEKGKKVANKVKDILRG